MATPTKAQRWLDLIAYLAGRRSVAPVDEIMEKVPAYAAKWDTGDVGDREAVRRMFERDKDELRERGIPIQTEHMVLSSTGEVVEGYRLLKGQFFLPVLRIVHEAARPRGRAVDKHTVPEFALEEDEARAAVDALRRVASWPAFPFREGARSALRKLAFDLDLERFEPPPVLYADRADSQDVAARVVELFGALRRRKRVEFRYHGIHRGAATDRKVCPYGLFLQRGHWYLVGWDETRNARRVFRVARMETPRTNRVRPHTPDYEIPGDFRLDSYLGRQAWELGGEDEPPLEARVEFPFPLSLWANRNGLGELAERGRDGSEVRTFRVHQVSPFLRWLLAFRGEARLLEPPALVEELRKLASEVRALYTEAETERGGDPTSGPRTRPGDARRGARRRPRGGGGGT
jgi:proteasome accessory factor B